MKPDWARAESVTLARAHHHHLLGDIASSDDLCNSCTADIQAALERAYAAGYRDGQERMKYRFDREGFAPASCMTIEDPPT